MPHPPTTPTLSTMSSPARNPYAAPGASGEPLPEPIPLPSSVRRFPLDPTAYRAAVRGRLLRFLGIFAAIIAVVGFALRGSLVGGALWIWLAVVTFSLGAATIRVQRIHRRSFATYDLLVGPRAVRRTVGGFPPAEVLRPEVTAVYETRWGMWLWCDAPPRALFLSRAIAAYEELRATLDGWQRIETLRGWTAWRRATTGAARQGPRDVVAGTSLAADVSLAHELEELRRASSTAWMAHPQLAPRARPLRRLLILWALLIVLFFAIWQFLQPSSKPRLPSRPPLVAPGP